MAERRMLSSKIICSDAFIEMPHSTQCLYIQFNMAADDDGFLNSPIRVMRTVCAKQDDLEMLLEKRVILRFPNGVIVIKHWRIHNQIRKDRYTPTQYQNEFNSLVIRDDGAYTEKEKADVVDNLATTWQPNGNQTAPQDRLGKVSLGKFSIEEEKCDSVESESPVSCQQIVDLYNSICKSFPSVRSLSDARRKAIKARLNTYSFEDFKTVFENAEASSFLKGSNDRNWSANFDWLIKDSNIAKVLEGNYANKGSRYTRKETVPGWMCEKRELGKDEVSAIKRLMSCSEEEFLGIGGQQSDPSIEAEAEQLRQKMQEKYGKGDNYA